MNTSMYLVSFKTQLIYVAYQIFVEQGWGGKNCNRSISYSIEHVNSPLAMIAMESML